MKKKIITIGIIVIFFILSTSGCFEDNGKKKNDGDQIVQKNVLPDIVIAHSTGIMRLTYNNDSNIYSNASFTKSYLASNIEYVKDSFFIVKDNTLSRLNEDLEMEKTLDLNNVGSFAASDDTIFISYNDSFASFNYNLVMLDSFELNVTDDTYGSVKKNAHDIVIYENQAYLLDNILFPIFILIVDIENPQSMQIKNSAFIWGINQHLNDQCLIPELKHWLILQSTSHMIGHGQSMIICSMDNSEELESYNVYDNSWLDTDDNYTSIECITELSPALAIVLSNNSYYLTKVNYNPDFSNNITYSDFVDLNLSKSNGYSQRLEIKRSDNYLFICYENKLIVIDVENEFEIILSQEIDGIQIINDFALITSKI